MYDVIGKIYIRPFQSYAFTTPEAAQNTKLQKYVILQGQQAGCSFFVYFIQKRPCLLNSEENSTLLMFRVCFGGLTRSQGLYKSTFQRTAVDMMELITAWHLLIVAVEYPPGIPSFRSWSIDA